MSILRIYEIARRSLQSTSAAINTAGQNIANANTEGYSRQRVTLQPDSIASRGIHSRSFLNESTGVGVSVAEYQRIRDTLLDATSWEARAAQGSGEEEARILSALEGAFAVGSDGSLLNVFNDFWDAWNDVANHPTDTSARTALLNKADALTTTLHRTAQDVDTLKVETQTALTDGVDTVNGLIEEIATLNKDIREAEFTGVGDYAAEDKRDQLVKELASYVPVQVQQKEQGYTITVDGMSVVQGDHATPLTIETNAGVPTIYFGDTGVAFDPPAGDDGKLGALQRTVASTIPDVVDQLDALAADLVTTVNGEHTNGYGLDNGTGRDFFDSTQLTASTITRSDDVDAPEKVGAASGPDLPGDSTIAQNIYDLRDGLTGDAVDLISDVGSKVEQAQKRSAGASATVEYLDGLAQGVSGVSIDEEMTRLIEYQQSFAASARVLQTAQSMMDTLLAI